MLLAQYANTEGKAGRFGHLHNINAYQGSLVFRPPSPAFVACSTKSGRRPGQIYHVMCVMTNVTYCS